MPRCCARPSAHFLSAIGELLEARTERYKRLFGCPRKMVASDSTLARVLRWLDPQQVKAFLLSFLGKFEQRDLLRKRLSPGGRLRRLGILDGSYMGGHWLVTLCLAGAINYPVMVRRCEGQGEELAVARDLMRQAPTVLGKQRPELWLLDALYFNKNTIVIARGQGAHVLFKFKDADLRVVTKDAQKPLRALRRGCGAQRLGQRAAVSLDGSSDRGPIRRLSGAGG